MIISLIGFMAAGKTTIGVQLARSLNAPIIDLDAYIEEKEGKTISDIFEKEGEKHFRDLEEKYLEDILEQHISEHPDTLNDFPEPTITEDDQPMLSRKCTLILSLGGGTPTNTVCAELISKLTYCIYIKTNIETILDRLSASSEQENRPMLTLEQTILELYKSREPIYEKLAQKVLET